MLANIIRMGVGKLRRLIDRRPTIVVNQSLSLLGNGGRKLVRLDNGWLVSAMLTSNGWALYISKDFGEKWGLLYISAVFSPDITISSIGNNKVVVLVYRSNSNEVVYYNINCENGVQVGYGVLENNITAMGKMSIQTNKDKTEIYLCWSRKHIYNNNTYNIIYVKAIINENGNLTFSAIEATTSSDATRTTNVSPTIVVLDNKPIIICEYHNVDYHRILCLYNDSGNWLQRSIYVGDPYPQSSPSSCVDTDGVILVTWHGTDEYTGTVSFIRFNKCTSNGVALESTKRLVAGINPSITVDKNGIYYIEYQYNNYSQMIKSLDKGKNWSSPVAIVISTNPSTLYDNKLELDFEVPLCIRQTSNNILFDGKWYE